MIIILGAMDGEISAFLTAVHIESREKSASGCEIHIGTLENRSVAVAKAGVGKVLSAVNSQSIIEHLRTRGTPAQAIIFTGLAGAVRPELEIGDTVVSADCVQHDLEALSLGISRGTVPYSPYRFLAADKNLYSAAMSYQPEEGRVVSGRILTGDQFISSRDFPSYSYLVDELDGHAVEMEGAAVALCAAVNSIPFLLIRTISDRADGSASVNFRQFLPKASENSLRAVQHVLGQTW